MKRLHPVARKEEIPIDIEIAAIVPVRLRAQRLNHMRLVQVFGDPVQLLIAETAVIGALDADVVGVLAGPLVGPDDGVVAVDGGGDAGPDAAGIVAGLDEGFAAGKGVVHGSTFAFVEDGGPAAVAAGHGAVPVVLSQAVDETVANKDGFEINVALLEGEDLGSEDGNIVAGVGFAGDVEVLVGILRELLEEEGEKGKDVFAGGDSVGDGGAAVGEANVDGLVEKDDTGVGIPAVGVVDEVEILIDGCRTEFKEKTGEGGTARATVDP